MKKIVMDLDGTLTCDGPEDYSNKKPNREVIEQLKKYKSDGFYIAIHTARNMRTYEGDVELIKKNTLPVIIEWLVQNGVPFDEVIVGKPWCGFDGFYVDDRAIRPSEFANLSYQEIQQVLNKENPYKQSGNEL